VKKEIDVQENCDQDKERYQDEFQLEFTRLFAAGKPSPDQGTGKSTEKSDNCNIQSFFGKMIVSD
jgi:hypothetical protein